MLRCSTLILSIAVCFVCSPNLFGQTIYGTGFPARLDEALDKKTVVKPEQVKQRSEPSTTDSYRKPFGRGKSEVKSSNQRYLDSFANQPTDSPKKSLNPAEVKGVPFKPTPSYQRYQTKPKHKPRFFDSKTPKTPYSDVEKSSKIVPQLEPTKPTFSGIPKPFQRTIETSETSSPVNQSPVTPFGRRSETLTPKQTSTTPTFTAPTTSAKEAQQFSAPKQFSAPLKAPAAPASTATTPASTPTVPTSLPPAPVSTPTASNSVPTAPTIAPPSNPAPQPKLSDVDPEIRREIEEQVRRDLEKKFESEMEARVKKQVRAEVWDARQKLENARKKLENATRNRVAARPLTSSTYRAPGQLRQPPSIQGQVLPVIVPGDSQPPQRDKSHAHYLITDGLPDTKSYKYEMNSNPPPQSNGQMIAPPKPKSLESNSLESNSLESAPAQQLYNDGARSKPQSDESAQVASNGANTSSESNQQPAANAGEAPPSPQFMLRTSVIGPEALLKDQSDEYEIAVSNVSNQPATNIIVQLTVPDEITISRLDRDAYLDPESRTVSWKVATIAAGQKEVIKYRALSSSAGKYEQQITLGMENTFQGKTPFTTVVQVGAPSLPVNPDAAKDYAEVAERLEFDE